MKLFYKDGITVQAINPQQEAHYKSLGFVPVEGPKPPKAQGKEEESKPPKGKGKEKTPPEAPAPEE